jgi:hypothetical protein
MIVSIVVTLIIFIIIVSYYDVFREKIIYSHSSRIAKDIRVASTSEERDKIVAVAKESYHATIDYAVMVTIIGFVSLPPLLYMYSKL